MMSTTCKRFWKTRTRRAFTTVLSKSTSQLNVASIVRSSTRFRNNDQIFSYLPACFIERSSRGARHPTVSHNCSAQCSYIQSLLQEEVAAGIESKNIIVAGFSQVSSSSDLATWLLKRSSYHIDENLVSQGGVMSLLSLKQELPLAGVVCICGYLTLANETPVVSAANATTPILMCSGERDDIVRPSCHCLHLCQA